jgi:hypothetical protein
MSYIAKWEVFVGVFPEKNEALSKGFLSEYPDLPLVSEIKKSPRSGGLFMKIIIFCQST